MGIFKKGPIKEAPKINCLACGKEHDYDSKYCKHCGAPVEPEKQKIPPHLNGKKSKKGLFVVLLVVIIIITMISIIFIVGFKDVDENVTYTYSPMNTPSSLKIELDMYNASVEIKFTDELTDPVVKLDYHKKWRGFVHREPSFKTSSTKVSFKGSRVFGEADSELTVILRSDVEYDIYSTISSGSIALNADGQGVVLGTLDFDSLSSSIGIHGDNLTITEQIKLKSEDGSSSVFLKDSTIGDIDGTFIEGSSTSTINLENCIVKDIHVSGDSKSVILNSKDTTIISHSSWTFNVDSGGLGLNIEQSHPLGADVTVDAYIAGKRDIKVNFNGNATYIRTKFTGNKNIDIKENVGFVVIDSKTLESSNFSNETMDKFEIKMTANKGDLKVDVSNL